MSCMKDYEERKGIKHCRAEQYNKPWIQVFTSCYCMSSAPSHATSCCFSSAIYGCVFLLYYCCWCFAFCLFPSFSISHMLFPSVPLFRQAAISARRSSHCFFFSFFKSPLLTAAFCVPFFSHFSSSTAIVITSLATLASPSLALPS